MAKALGIPAAPFSPADARGAALRLEARLAHGASLTVVARPTAISDEALMIHRWEYGRDCP